MIWDQIYTATFLLRLICYCCFIFIFTYRALHKTEWSHFCFSMSFLYSLAIVLSIAVYYESGWVPIFRAVQTGPLIVAACLGLYGVYRQEF